MYEQKIGHYSIEPIPIYLLSFYNSPQKTRIGNLNCPDKKVVVYIVNTVLPLLILRGANYHGVKIKFCTSISKHFYHSLVFYSY